MLRLASFGGPNDDLALVDETQIYACYRKSDGPQPFTVIVLSNGVTIAVKDNVEAIENGIQAGKESRKAQS
jgi:hypothetical protein